MCKVQHFFFSSFSSSQGLMVFGSMKRKYHCRIRRTCKVFPKESCGKVPPVTESGNHREHFHVFSEDAFIILHLSSSVIIPVFLAVSILWDTYGHLASTARTAQGGKESSCWIEPMTIFTDSRALRAFETLGKCLRMLKSKLQSQRLRARAPGLQNQQS